MSPDRESELARRHPSYVAANLLNAGCAHGDGWFDIIDRLLGAIEAVQPGGVRIVQIKQKMGRLRVYADGANPASAALIAGAEAESVTVCEQCGEPGTWRRARRTATLCERHREEVAQSEPGDAGAGPPADHVVAVAGSRGYSCPDAVREQVAQFGEHTIFLVGDRGAVSAAVVATARAHGRRVQRFDLARAEARGPARWWLRNRRLIAEADAVLVFAERPCESLWSLIGQARNAGHAVEVYGPDGALWNPPTGPADPRSAPFYVPRECPSCGAVLVLSDLADNPEADPAAIWYDEWICLTATCRAEGTVTDWPRWRMRHLLAAPESEAGDCMTGAEFGRRMRRSDRLEKKAVRCLEGGDLKAARRAVDALLAESGGVARWHELSATVARAQGDKTEELASMRAAFDSMLDQDAGLNPESFKRIRDGIRRLLASSISKGALMGNRKSTPTGSAEYVMTPDDRKDAAAIKARGPGQKKRKGDGDYDDLLREIERLERKLK